MISHKIQFNMNQKTVWSKNNITYYWINFGICLTLVLMFLFLKFSNLHLECVYKTYGESCSACGLTTTFRHILQGKWELLNSTFGHIFIFFTGQFFARICISFLILSVRKQKAILALDLSLSLLWLVYAIIDLY